MLQILPAILATTEEEYKQKLTQIETSFQLFNGWVQIDLMDNKFVQNKSVGVDILAKYPTKELQIEAQLMVEYPDNWIDELVKTHVTRIVFPLEDIAGIESKIQHVLNHQKEVGLSINPETPVEKLEPFLSTINTVLVMSVPPGFGGQQFIPESIEKVRKIKQLGMPIRVGVDGGINLAVVKQLSDAGADYLVMGSHLLQGDINENIRNIRQTLGI
jgi:ribulose-phosphate 3-epimerase